ncbi:hypothetical protein BVI1335_400062 [Burkholderia vietnamiensis]|nr:hypothetical protein BVI1335_400062 [Burkholderia vietnamiensis]
MRNENLAYELTGKAVIARLAGHWQNQGLN